MTDCCNECGRSVKGGSGNFVDRIPSLDDEDTQKNMGKLYPEGQFIDAQCEATYYAEEGEDDGEGHTSKTVNQPCNNCQQSTATKKKLPNRVIVQGGDILFRFCNKDCYDDFYGLGKHSL